MNCPICGKHVKKSKNPNPSSEMHVYSDYSGSKEYYDGPVDIFNCPECRGSFYMTPSNQNIAKRVEKYYEIIGKHTKRRIGVCCESGKADVLSEEPEATFRRISKREYERTVKK